MNSWPLGQPWWAQAPGQVLEVRLAMKPTLGLSNICIQMVLKATLNRTGSQEGRYVLCWGKGQPHLFCIDSDNDQGYHCLSQTRAVVFCILVIKMVIHWHQLGAY